MSPRPKTSAISGVIATSGTERSTIAIGMKVCSIGRRRLNTIAHKTAAVVPATRPMNGVPQRRERVVAEPRPRAGRVGARS